MYGNHITNMNIYLQQKRVQLCGWIVTHDLWLGAVSDTMYQEKCGILKLQEDFAKSDMVGGKEIPFLNISDQDAIIDAQLLKMTNNSDHIIFTFTHFLSVSTSD